MTQTNEFDDGLTQQWLEGQAQHRAEQLAAAIETWAAYPAQPYLLTFSGPLEDRPHRFCPRDPVPGADCPNCRQPLLQLLSLETNRLPFAIRPAFLPLLYCWTCAIPFDLFSYRVHDDGTIEILQYLDSYADSFGPGGPYEGYSGSFPETMVGLRPLSDEEQRLARQLQANEEFPAEHRDLTDPVHQVGGFPMIYNPQEVSCPVCGQDAPFFATVCDNAVGQEYQADPSLTFTGNCGVQMVFHWCAQCSVMTAYHSCD